MVVERSNASYLIGGLGMRKVEGSNPGSCIRIYFRDRVINSHDRAQTRMRMRGSYFFLSRMRETLIFGFSIEVDVLSGWARGHECGRV